MTPDIVYHGGGYAGLTGAVHFALAGKQVLIYDPDEQVVDGINSGHPKAGEFLRYLSGEHVGLFGHRVRATPRFLETVFAPVHIITAPSERHDQPEMSIVLSILDRIVRNTEAHRVLIIVESTLTPGTLDYFLDRPLEGERIAARILLEDMHSFRLAAAPRRDWFADPSKNVRTLARVVGGVTYDCTAAAVECLSHVSDIIYTTDYRTAELVKPLENALLHVPLMMVHELALDYPRHDVAEAVRLAGTHWRLFPLHLNFGAGGRCVPLGPKYLAAGTSQQPSMLEEAIQVDQDMRGHVASCASQWLYDRGLKGTGRVLILGMAYRPDFKDAGSSPGVGIARMLIARGVRTVIHDPMWSPEELLSMVPGVEVSGSSMPDPVPDVVLLSTLHAMYRDWPLCAQFWKSGQIVLDAQGAWREHQHRLRSFGVDYRQVGKPGWSA